MDVAFRTTGLFKFVLPLAFVLGACSEQVHQLPDDPDNEPTSITKENDNGNTIETGADTSEAPIDLSPSTEDAILAQYNHLDPQHVVPTQALREAVLYFHTNKANFTNTQYLSVIDFTQSSKKKRFHIINLQTGSVWSLHVAHGKGSDSNHDGFAEKFSNVSGSNASSLGFYKTAETYQGKHGYSLRLDGLSTSNSKARARAIVIHGADYVQDREVIQGRSWGCPAVSMAHYKALINMVKGGSLIYAVGGNLSPSLASAQ